MVEIVLAAAVPATVAWFAAGLRWFSDETRRAVRWWIIPAVLLWFAPCWLTGGSPGGFDYLFADIVPWRQQAASTANALLSDSALQFLPWREAARDAVLRGAMPFLNRYAGSGSPLWENPQAAVAYPLTLAGLPFSTFAWPLFASISKLLICATGTYAFLRGRAVSRDGALVGAFAWTFGAFTTAFTLFPHTNVTILLPWLLVAIDACGRTARAVPGMAVALACMVLGGHPESVLHAAVVAIPLAATVVFASQERVAIAQRYLIGGVCGLALAAPLLMPFAAYLPHSERVARLAGEKEVIAAPALTAQNLVPFLFAGHFAPPTYPDENFAEVATQYVGVVAIALAAFAALIEWRRPFWTILFLLTAFFAFSSPLADAVVARIPVFDISMNGRLRFVCAFAAAVLAARGVDRLRERPRLFLAMIAGAVAFVGLTLLVSWDDYGPFARSALLRGSAAMGGGLVAMVMVLRGAVSLLPVAVFVDLAALLIPYHPAVPRAAFYPATPAIEYLQRQQRPVRFVGIGWTLLPNSGVILGLEDIGAHDPVAFGPYLDLLAQGGYDRSDYHHFFPRVPPTGLLHELGVGYIVAPPEADSTVVSPVYRGADAVIFPVPGAVPRVAVGEGATVESVEYRPDRVRIVVDAARETVVRSGEVALPGWRLLRQGQRWPVAEGGAPLLTWTAPAGRSVFELRYRPVGLGSGVAACLGAIALLVVHGRRGGGRRGGGERGRAGQVSRLE